MFKFVLGLHGRSSFCVRVKRSKGVVQARTCREDQRYYFSNTLSLGSQKKKQSIFFPLRKCFFIQVLLESMTLTRRHWIARFVMFIQWCSWRTLCVDSKIFTIILCIFTGRAETHRRRRLLFATSDGWKHHLLLARQRLPWRLIISQILKIKEKKKTIRFCNG